MSACYKELYEINELAAAFYLQELIAEVSDELRGAQEKFINLEAMNYDLSQIVSEQEQLYEKYNEKIKHLYEDDIND